MAKFTVEFLEGPTEKIEKTLEITTAEDGAEVVRNALTLFQHVALLVMEPNTHLALVAGNDIKKIIIVPGVTYPNRF